MQRFLSATTRRAYSSSRFALAAPAAGGSAPVLKLNLVTPHNSIYVNKIVDTAVLPGENGEYSVNAGITPVISQLKPGVVQVNHTDVRKCFFFPKKYFLKKYLQGKSEQFFVPGGFAISNADSVTVSLDNSFMWGNR